MAEPVRYPEWPDGAPQPSGRPDGSGWSDQPGIGADDPGWAGGPGSSGGTGSPSGSDWSDEPGPMRPRRPAPSVPPRPGLAPAGRHLSGAQHVLRRRKKTSGDGGSGGADEEPASALSAAIGAVTEVVVVVAMALALALVIKTFLVQAFFIPSASMENTLLTGDRVLVSKLTPGPFSLHRGDIVVFKDPGGWLTPQAPAHDGPVRRVLRDGLTFVGLLPQDSGEHLIKRVIGLPGDKVACCDSRGRVTVNGVPIDEPYLYPANAPSATDFTVTVPAGHLWVMGDHRSVSEDSRYNRDVDDGTVPVSDVVGKAFVIVWPLNRFTTLGVPSSVFGRVPDPPAAK